MLQQNTPVERWMKAYSKLRFWTGKLCHLVRTGENVLLCHRKNSLHTQYTNVDTSLMQASSNPDFYIIYLRFDWKSVSILCFQFVTNPSFTLAVAVCLLLVPFRETPSYANRRRAPGPLPSPRSLLRSASDNNLNGDHDHIHSQAPRETRGRRGHSPVPSLRSLPAFGQQHGSLGEVRQKQLTRVWHIYCKFTLSNTPVSHYIALTWL